MNKLFLPIVIFTILFSSATLNSIHYAFADIVLDGAGENVLSIDSTFFDDGEIPTLRKINPDTGATISSVEITQDGSFPDGFTITGGRGLALNPDDGVLYALLKVSDDPGNDSGTTFLVTLNPRTGVATFIGEPGDRFAAIAFIPGNTLFGVTTKNAVVDSTLFTLSTQDASATEVCELANGVSEDGRALAFLSTDGSLYHAFSNTDLTLERIDDTSGATCLVTDIPISGLDTSFFNPTGLVFRLSTNEFLIANREPDLHTISANPGTINFVGAMSDQSRGLAIFGPPVGGELLPINTAALLIAGMQSSALWILPVLAGAAGAGAYFVRTRQNKD